MDYFSILNLNREPFSNSPDPEYFYKSRQHFGCLQKVELALRLKRGLNIGEVGTGKTTLCRQLLRSFAEDELIETHLILDPSCIDAREFLLTVARTIGGDEGFDSQDEWQIKEHIKKILYRKGVEEERIVILIIDEGQKLPTFCIELLREFLNFETNEHKLFQIAIFAQTEFDQTLDKHANFADRANLIHYLEPMNFRDTKDMIRYRLRQSSKVAKPVHLFTLLAIWAIYRATNGHPRKIINLCHQSILAMIIQNRSRIGWRLVRSCVKRAVPGKNRFSWALVTALLLVSTALVAVAAFLPAPYLPGKYLQQGLRQTIERYKVSATIEKPGTSNLSNGVAERVAKPAPLPRNQRVVQPPLSLSNPEPKEPQQSEPLKVVAQPGPMQTEPGAISNPIPITPGSNGGEEVALVQETQPAPQKVVTDEKVNAESEPRIVPPLFLGRLTVHQGDSLIKLITRVRGSFNPDYLESLLALNPHITNPDSINVGDEIVVPAIPVTVSPVIRESWRLEMASVSSLDRAVDVASTLQVGIPSARVLPFWDAADGLRFTVLLQELFPNEISARARLSQLPAKLAKDVAVKSDWAEGTVFFANPF